jgi:hypothetical protein
MSTIKLNSNIPKKPFCKVCQDAGKPESEYTNHYVRSLPDQNGNTKVTCPTLNNTECRYCYKLGHTTKFCPVISEKSNRYKRDDTKKLQKPIEKAPQKKPNTSFDLLSIDSDNEDFPVANIDKNEFPSLTSSKKTSASPEKVLLSYASMAEKPAAPPVCKQVVKLPVISKPIKSWADESDSEEELDTLPDIDSRLNKLTVSYEDQNEDEW